MGRFAFTVFGQSSGPEKSKEQMLRLFYRPPPLVREVLATGVLVNGLFSPRFEHGENTRRSTPYTKAVRCSDALSGLFSLVYTMAQSPEVFLRNPLELADALCADLRRVIALQIIQPTGEGDSVTLRAENPTQSQYPLVIDVDEDEITVYFAGWHTHLAWWFSVKSQGLVEAQDDARVQAVHLIGNIIRNGTAVFTARDFTSKQWIGSWSGSPALNIAAAPNSLPSDAIVSKVTWSSKETELSWVSTPSITPKKT